ncbi:MAG: hypothetical protein J6K92_03810 [Oscillospiraceae bacterium]|nr:hypothetical protein [Oscillospiraceae bacterium]
MKINNPIIITALALLVFSACDKSDGAQENIAATQQSEVYQMQEGDTQVSGEVVSIVGNEVTLALGEVTERKMPPGDMPDNGESSDNDNSSSGERPARGDKGGFSDGEMPDFGSPEKGERPDFADGEAPDPGNFEKDVNGGGQFGNKRGGANAALEKNGESGTYIIPVGMTVSGLSGRSSDYSGISEGDILTLTIDSEGTVKSAEVR